jgi:hypothetical protein
MSLLHGNGIGAIVAPGCLAESGTIIETLVPISDTDWWFTEAEVLSSTCRTLPSGEKIENFSVRVLSIVPLPDRAHRGSLADGNVFDIYVPGVGLVVEGIGLSCFFDGASGGETLDGSFTTTPSGMSHAVCRFPASGP